MEYIFTGKYKSAFRSVDIGLNSIDHSYIMEGIRGKKFRDIFMVLYETMEDDAIYDGPIFRVLYLILSMFNINIEK